ncbi:prolyl oligopeptidase family-domain-containing protein [Scenedesmus sp. NREL 46B-D3]|nr:prolyl oligopeptidase family-domain-containing protein [Scenedesmus sp. NREL 46B-D3]
MAYSLEMDSQQQEAAEQYCCVVRDLHAGRLLPGCVLPNVSSYEWSADASCLYYCVPDEQGRPSKVFRRTLEQGDARQSHDQLLFTEADPKHFVTLTRTKDWRYVLINSHCKLSSEVHMIDASSNSRNSHPVCLHPRTAGLEYFVEHWRDHLLLLTNSSSRSSPPAPLQPHCSHGTSWGAQPKSLTAGTMLEPASAAAAPPAAAAAAADSVLTTAGPGDEGDYCLMTLPAALAGCAGAESWRMLLPVQPAASVTDMDVFDGCVVLHELCDARPRLRLLQLAEQQGEQLQPELQALQQQEVALPGWALAMRPGINQDYSGSSMRLYASSPAVPEVPLEVDLNTGQLAQLQSNEQPHEQQQQQQQPEQPHHTIHTAADSPPAAQQPVCKQLWAAAPDGTRVPVTLLHSQGLRYDGDVPLLVEVYGAYGQVLEADFRAHRLALLQRGWAVALAHVRGGGEGGRRWHAAGRQLLKPNSVSDLLACLRLLVQLRVTSPGRIAGHAASAGGLTLAAAVNAAPELFSAVVLEAPFVDWAGAMSAAAAGHVLTEHETDEWGDPMREPLVAGMAARMCPYSNLRAGVEYPAVLVTAGLRDARVPFWMPAKYVAKLRSLQQAAEGSAVGVQHEQELQQRAPQTGQRLQQQRQGRRPVLLQFAEAGGHFSMGQSGGDMKDIALQYAFLIAAL